MNEWSILRLWTWCMGRTRSSRSTVSVTSAISQLNYTVPTWASLGAMQLWPTRKTWLKYIQVHYHCAVWVELPSTSCSIVVICVQLDFTGRKFSHGSQDEGGMHQSESLGKKCRAEAWFSVKELGVGQSQNSCSQEAGTRGTKALSQERSRSWSARSTASGTLFSRLSPECLHFQTAVDEVD